MRCPVSSSDGFATFTIDLPLSPGSNNVSVLVEGPAFDRLKFFFAGRVKRVDPILVVPTDLDFDAKHDRFVLVDRATRSVQLLDVTSGGRTIVSDLDHGSGPPFGEPSGIAVDADGSRAFVLEGNQQAIDAVDLATGARSGLSGGGKGGGPALDFPIALAFDVKRGRLLVADFEGATTGLSPSTFAYGLVPSSPTPLTAAGRAWRDRRLQSTTRRPRVLHGERRRPRDRPRTATGSVLDATHGTATPPIPPPPNSTRTRRGPRLDDDRVVEIDAKTATARCLSGDGAGGAADRPARRDAPPGSPRRVRGSTARRPAITKILVKEGSRNCPSRGRPRRRPVARVRAALRIRSRRPPRLHRDGQSGRGRRRRPLDRRARAAERRDARQRARAGPPARRRARRGARPPPRGRRRRRQPLERRAARRRAGADLPRTAAASRRTRPCDARGRARRA
jgi:hypothetical protein